MDLEVVQWEVKELHAIAFVCMLAVSPFELVHLELGAVVTGCLGHQNLSSHIFRCLFRLGIPAEPNSSKAAAAKLHFSVQDRQNLASEVTYFDPGNLHRKTSDHCHSGIYS
jgi:hypothetical protein